MPEASSGLRLLLVGGPPPLAAALRAGGHALETPPDALAVRVAVRSSSPDVVILDLEAAESDPFRLAEGICDSSGRRKPLLLALAGTDTDEQDRKCRQAGIDLLLFKPIHLPGLLGFLNRLRTVVEDYESFDPVI